MLSGFPQLDSLLKQRGGINQAAQQQQPQAFQNMPDTGPPKVPAPGMMGEMAQNMSQGFTPNPEQEVTLQAPQSQPMAGGFAKQQPAQMYGGFQQLQPQQQPQQPQSDARPLGQFGGMNKQRMFNQAQKQANGGLAGGKFNRRRF